MTAADDPDIHLLAAGRQVRPVAVEDDLHVFSFRTAPRGLRLRSRSQTPSLTGPAGGDPRRLGVAVGRVTIRSKTLSVEAGASSPLLSDGFHAHEGVFRWTDGDAAIPDVLLDLFNRESVRIEVDVRHKLPAYDAPEPDETPAAAPSVFSPGDWGARPVRPGEHYENLAFSTCGGLIAVAAAGANEAHILRREGDGRFEAAPFLLLAVAAGYPHGVAFARVGKTEVLAVVSRSGFVSAWAMDGAGSREPRFRPIARDLPLGEKMVQTDSLAFLPPDGRTLAVSDYASGVLRLYHVVLNRRGAMTLKPRGAFAHPDLLHLDGIAVSSCGRWLAASNHADHSVTVFRRRGLRFEPATTIRDFDLRFPHSMAICPVTDNLFVTSAGSPDIKVYAALDGPEGRRWSQTPADSLSVVPETVFAPVNEENPMEGGLKGVGLFGGEIAVCSPELGLRVGSYTPGPATPKSRPAWLRLPFMEPV